MKKLTSLSLLALFISTAACSSTMYGKKVYEGDRKVEMTQEWHDKKQSKHAAKQLHGQEYIAHRAKSADSAQNAHDRHMKSMNDADKAAYNMHTRTVSNTASNASVAKSVIK